MSPRNAKAQPPITVGARTDVGQVRAQNEDSMLVKLPLLVVADGIGGQEAGEVASQIAIETMEIEAPVSADAQQLGQFKLIRKAVAGRELMIQDKMNDGIRRGFRQ